MSPWLQRIAFASPGRGMLRRILAKKAKKHAEIDLDEEDMALLVEIREAYTKHLREKEREEKEKERERVRQTPAKEDIHFASWRRAEDVPKEEGKSSGPPPLWDEFLEANYDGGRKKVKNTSTKKNTRAEVRVTTLMKTDKAFMKQIMEEYRRWAKEQGEDEEDEEGASKPSAAKSVFGVQFPEEYDLDEISKEAESALKKLGLNSKDALDLAGMGSIVDPSVFLEIKMDRGRVVVTGLGNHGPQLDDLKCTLDFKNETLTLDHITLSPNAPKGVGTKFMASQIEKARALGLKRVKLNAFRDDPKYVGYAVWPRLGYDGDIPVGKTGLPKKFQDALTDAGHKQPWKIQQLFSIGKDAIDWWDEQGTSFDAEFDLSDDSTSMKLFEAYVKKKGGYDKLVASA